MALMQWRALIMIMQLDQMFDWSWKNLLENITGELTNVLKSYASETIVTDFLRLTFSKDKFLSLV